MCGLRVGAPFGLFGGGEGGVGGALVGVEVVEVEVEGLAGGAGGGVAVEEEEEGGRLCWRGGERGGGSGEGWGGSMGGGFPSKGCAGRGSCGGES